MRSSEKRFHELKVILSLLLLLLLNFKKTVYKKATLICCGFLYFIKKYEVIPMNIGNIILFIVTIFVFVYLIYVLFFPTKF